MQSAQVASACLEWFAEPGQTDVPDEGLGTLDPFMGSLAAGVDPPPADHDIPPRVASVHRCLRPDDMQLVGRTGHHGTFFQMATCLSPGTNGIADLARSAWTLTTSDVTAGGLGIQAERLRVAVSDDDIAKIWVSEVGLEDGQILKREPSTPAGADDPAGDVVLSELILDRGSGSTKSAAAGPGGQALGLWKLHGRRDGGAAAIGLGLERIAMACQDVGTFSETDQVRPVLDRIAELTGAMYDETQPEEVASVRMRVAADHVRAALILADTGVTPDAAGQGLVLRKLVRRTTRALRLLGLDAPMLAELLPTARDLMAPSYPSVAANYEQIERSIVDEETQFRTTSGPRRAKSGAQTPVTAPAIPSPTVADPAERAQLEAVRADSGPTDWRGYERLQTSVRVVAILAEDRPLSTAAQGAVVDVVLDRTPFFATRCGQASDRGTMTAEGVRAQVFEARWTLPDLVVHRVRVDDGELQTGAELTARVDPDQRRAACQAHSATHVLQAALRERLGDEAIRRDSADEPGRIVVEIDPAVTWSDDIARDVELRANDALRRDLLVSARTIDREAALASGALDAHGVGEGSSVRVVEIGTGWSREMCDGTHVVRTSQIGLIALTDSWITSSGRRGIEAVCGLEGLNRLTRDRDLVRDLSSAVGTTSEQLLTRVKRLASAAASKRAAAPEVTEQVLRADAAAAATTATSVAGTSYAEARTSHAAKAKELAELIRDRLDTARPGVVVVTGGSGQRLTVVVAVNQAGVSAGLSADELISSGLKTHTGSGSGLAEGPVDSRQRGRAIARIRTKIGVVSGSLAT